MFREIQSAMLYGISSIKAEDFLTRFKISQAERMFCSTGSEHDPPPPTTPMQIQIELDKALVSEVLSGGQATSSNGLYGLTSNRLHQSDARLQ